MPARGQLRHSESDMIEALRRVAGALGRTPRSDHLNKWGYPRFKRSSDPTAATIIAHFGSWNAAVEAAGLKPHPRDQREVRARQAGWGQRTFTDAELLEAVAALVAVDPYLTVARYRAEAPENAPCVALIRRRLRKSIGTWTDIVESVGGRSGGHHRPASK